MSDPRMAQILRALAKNRDEEARLLEELAHAYEDPASNDAKPARRVPVRAPYVPPPRPVSDIAAARADRALSRAGATRR